jgi:hypothetical protein
MNPRVYRLRPPDRTGWALGLTGPQTVTVGITVVVVTIGLSRGLPAPAAVAMSVTGATLGLVRITGTPLITEVPSVFRWASCAVRPAPRWYAPLPPQSKRSSLPDALAGQRLLTIDPADHGLPRRAAPIAVIHDRRGRLVAATLRAGSRQFGLLDPADQDRLLAGWADALRPLCREHNSIHHLRWSEWTAPAGVNDHESWLERQDISPTPGVEQYRALLKAAGPVATRHETLLTLTVRADRVPVEARHAHDRTNAAVEYLLRELRLLGDRLERAGIINHGPLGPAQLVRAVKIRLDPTRIAPLETLSRTLGQRADGVDGDDLQDLTLAAEGEWRYWRTDDAVHRSFHLRGWPRNELTAAWLAPLLLHPGITRTVTVALQPIAPTVSRRAVQRQAAKIDADAQHRADKGFRIGADHRWAARAVAEREEELASGHAELAYTGILTVTAATPETLEHHCTELLQAAATCGIEMQPLNGRHDLAVAASLPLARGISGSRQW